ncbi:hypothetical protein P3T37_000652 [Kitasatospora sp. MAA4]|uniref:hypothetical protein n=1 Tax=Kitasatospora sp. MAA4 TaxID=3035093 RepID=UPI002475712D|nr:hypothetical protein [Kitasatospora sp. MAA4]MDH6131283.1 hypothetical protein [Kitasatospora sp. MAA4]
MDENLVENRHVGLEVYLTVRRRGEPLRRVRLRTPAELALAQPLLAARSSQDEAERRRAAARLGLLVRPEDLPAAKEELGFRCDVDEELLRLLPSEHSAALPVLPAEALELNPRLCVQWEPQLPEELVGRVALGGADGGPVGPGPREFSSERPIVWVEDPRRGTLAPLWCGGTWGPELRRVAVEGADPRILPPGSLRPLQLAGVLLPRSDRTAPAPGAVEAVGTAGSGGQRVGVLRDLFSPLFLAALRRHFRRLRAEGYFRPDQEQVVDRRDGVYCDSLTLFLQHQLTATVAGWTGRAVRPSYTWVMAYRPGAVLQRHRDRPQCRTNVSFCVDADPEGPRADAWPFYVEGPDGGLPIQLGVGDAVMYSGTDQDHWRDALAEDRQVTVCLLHYVDADFTGPLG